MRVSLSTQHKRTNRFVIAPIWIVLLLVSTGCSVRGSADHTAATPAASATSQAAFDPQGLFFPQQAAVEGDRAVMEALTVGMLLVDNGCLRLVQPGQPSYLVVWPPDVALDMTQDFIQVRTKTGRLVAQVGSLVQMSGGVVDNVANQALSQPLPAECPGLYWIVGSEIGSPQQ